MQEHITEARPSNESRLLRDEIYAELRADMITCRLAPGTELRESALAERFGVSKSPVRDALMRLATEGLVVILPRQGYLVSSVSVTDVEDMFHLREALERACIERVVRRASDEDLEQLDRFRTYDEALWEGGFVHYNREFHYAVARIAGNARMRDYLLALIDQMERAVRISVSSLRKDDPQSLVNEHRELIDALQAHDLTRAQRLSSRHVTTAGKRVMRTLQRLVTYL
jgi:DNA-binding GntR family transcriptional regulator